MHTLVNAVHIVVSLLLVIAVLLQAGKGANQAGLLGGSSQTVFGSSGGANFFTRLTAVLATIFMATSLTLTILGSQSRKSIFEVPNKDQSQSSTKEVARPTGAPEVDPGPPIE